MTIEELLEACPHLACSEDFRALVRWEESFLYPRKDWNIFRELTPEQVVNAASVLMREHRITVRYR